MKIKFKAESKVGEIRDVKFFIFDDEYKSLEAYVSGRVEPIEICLVTSLACIEDGEVIFRYFAPIDQKQQDIAKNVDEKYCSYCHHYGSSSKECLPCSLSGTNYLFEPNRWCESCSKKSTCETPAPDSKGPQPTCFR